MAWFKKKKVEDVFTYTIRCEKETGWWSESMSLSLSLEFHNKFRNISRFHRFYIEEHRIKEGGDYHFLVTGTKEEKEEKFVKVEIMKDLEGMKNKSNRRQELQEIINKINMSGSLRLEEDKNETN